jgi:hypothetical protein
MTMQVYKTINGLGGTPTGARFISRLPWVTTDTTYCLRIVNLCEKAAIKYSIVWTGGEATLTATDVAGDTTGSATPVTLATTRRISAGAFWVDIERVAAGFDGVLEFRPTITQNNEIAHNDETDPSSLVTYRCVFIYAPEDMSIDSIAGDGIEIGVDALGATAEIIADEETAPSGIVFAATWSDGQAMLAGEWLPVWIKRTSAEDVGEHINTATITYTIATVEYTQILTGAYIVSLSARTPFYLYYQIAAPGFADQVYTVDTVGYLPIAVAALPYDVDMGAVQDTMHGSGYDDIVISGALRAATDSGAESQNQTFDYMLQLNYASGDVTKPNAPTINTFEFLTGGQVRLVIDHSQIDAVTRAARLYATDGVTTLRVTLPTDQDVTVSEFIFPTETTWGSSVTVSVYAQDSSGRQSTAATDTQDSLWGYSADKAGDIFTAARTNATPNYSSFDSETWGGVVATVSAGYANIALLGTTIIEARTNPTEGVKLYGLELLGQDVSGVGSADPIEIVSATEGYLCAGGVRVAKIDLSTNQFVCDQFRTGAAPQGCPVGAVYAEHDGVVYWQIYDPDSGSFKTYMAVDSNNNEVVFCYNLIPTD